MKGIQMKMQIEIEYKDGTKETHYVDAVEEKDNSLMYWIRFGVNEGQYYIPYSSIKRWKVCR